MRNWSKTPAETRTLHRTSSRALLCAQRVVDTSMGEVHRRVHHLVGNNLFLRSSSSSAYVHDKQHPRPLLLRHKIGWKHLQEPADFDRLEEFNSAVRSARMGSVTGVVVDGGGREKKATAATTAIRIHVSAAPERGEVAAPAEGASAPDRTANGGFIIRSPSRTSIAAPPPEDDDVFGECDGTGRAIEARRHVHPAPASGEFCGAVGDQDAGQSSQPSPSGKRSPSSDTTKPAAADDASGVDVNLYQKGLLAATAMDEEALTSEVAKYIGVEADQEQRPQRRAAKRRKTAAAPTKSAAPPVYFSLRLTDEEAMEDVLVVPSPRTSAQRRRRR